MATSSLVQSAKQFQNAVIKSDLTTADNLLQTLKGKLLELDSLPPLSLPSANSQEEISLARDVFEHAVILSVRNEDKYSFQNYLSILKPYRFGLSPSLPESPLANNITGLNLLYLLVENQLSDFHSELELLTEEQRQHPAIVFCTQLDQYLMIGSYDQVIAAASCPPVDYFSFFLKSLLETVRVNIWECVLSSYKTLTLTAATDMLMFSNLQETKDFLESKYSELLIHNELIDLTTLKNLKSEEELKSHRLIEQTLSYAAELERIV